MSHNVLQGHHHTEGHITADDRLRSKERYEDVLRLVDESSSYFLSLSKREALDAYLEQASLYPFPVPALLLLAVIQLDVLHSSDQLHDVALVGRCLLEPHIVELAPSPEEQEHPSDVECSSCEEYQEDTDVISCHYASVDEERHGRDDDAQERTGKEGLDPVVVADALHYVTHHLRVEERYRKPHQLAQKVRYERYAHPGGCMEHQPAADEVVGHLADRKYQLRYQQHYHERDVASADTGIHHRLGDERQYQADDAGHKHRQEYLDDERLVRTEIAEDVAETVLLLLITLLLVELGSRFKHQGYAVGVC